MKTVWIQSPFDNLPHEGFRKQRYWLMAEAFAAVGCRVVYLTSDFNHGTKARRVLNESPKDDSPIALVQIPTIPYATNVSLRRAVSHVLYAKRLAAYCRTAPSRPDLVISATPTLGAAAVLLAFARKVGARFVLDVQDAWPETFVRLFPTRLEKALGAALLFPLYAAARRLYRAADRVTGVSERYRQIVGRADYRVFYHGIAAPGSRAVRPPSARTAFRALVYLGNLGAGYDLATVIAAVGRDSTLTLDIAGRGPQEESLRKLVREQGLGARVRFHGYLDAEAVAALLARCDVGVVPMRDDSWVGLPYKLGDYLAAGLPVVSSLHGECGALLESEKLGETYVWGSPESLHDALKRLPGVFGTQGVAVPQILCSEQIYRSYVDFANL